MGIAASIACAVHCAVLPLLISSLPIFGVNIIHNITFEYGMILLAFCVGSFSLFHGYRKHHGRLLPLLFFTIGIVFLLAKQRWLDHEQVLLSLAVTCIVWAHLLNFKLNRRWSQMNETQTNSVEIK